MSRALGALRRLERHAARRGLGRVLPIKILTYEDGLYRGDNRTYTEDDRAALEVEYQLIIVCYGEDPSPGDGQQIQMTWGDHDGGRPPDEE